MAIEMHQWLLAGGAVAIAGLIRGFSGFGAAMVITPLLSLIWTPQQAVAIAVLFEVAASIPLMRESARQTQWREILLMAVTACLSVPLGTWLLVALNPTLIRQGVALIIFGFALIMLAGKRYTGKPRLPITLGTGVASGILTGAAGIGGPPVVLYLLSGPHQVASSRASFITYFGLTQMIALLFLWVSGLLLPVVVRNFLFLSPLFLGGLGLGHALFNVVDEKLFRYIVLGFFVAIALISFVG